MLSRLLSQIRKVSQLKCIYLSRFDWEQLLSLCSLSMRSCTQKQCHICNHKWNRVPTFLFRQNEYRSWQHLHWISHYKTISKLIKLATKLARESSCSNIHCIIPFRSSIYECLSNYIFDSFIVLVH
jgi:hypothetical protein